MEDFTVSADGKNYAYVSYLDRVSTIYVNEKIYKSIDKSVELHGIIDNIPIYSVRNDNNNYTLNE